MGGHRVEIGVGKTAVIPPDAVRVHHGRKAGGVGRDDHILGKAPLQAEAGHAEVRILIREFQVAGAVGGFRDAPRHPPHPAIGLLALHHKTAGLLQQAADRGAHHQRRHQIFEHGAGPGNQRACVAAGVAPRPRRNQCRVVASPLAMANRLASRASGANRRDIGGIEHPQILRSIPVVEI